MFFFTIVFFDQQMAIYAQYASDVIVLRSCGYQLAWPMTASILKNI